jgi:hypothetical protein
MLTKHPPQITFALRNRLRFPGLEVAGDFIDSRIFGNLFTLRSLACATFR